MIFLRTTAPTRLFFEAASWAGSKACIGINPRFTFPGGEPKIIAERLLSFNKIQGRLKPTWLTSVFDPG